MVYEPTLWHPNQDSPEDDVEGGGVLKENLEAEEGEQLQLTSPISIDPIRGQKQEDQAMQRTKDAWKNMQKNGKNQELIEPSTRGIVEQVVVKKLL